ncbi:MAG: LytR/AlgR family response regulator transcription factor [Akkermansiaceae bacterium]
MNCVIVEDEKLAQERLLVFLRDFPEIDVVGVASSGSEGLEMIHECEPDLVFLDIQLPGMTGLDVVVHLGEMVEQLPIVIFTTAYDEYAVRAFELCAFDYLLKPFSRERFGGALKRALTLKYSTGFRDEQLEGLVRQLSMRRGSKRLQRLSIKDGGKLFFVEMDSILWVDASGNYIEVHTKDREYLVRETLSSVEGKLSGDDFYRVSRFAIVNVNMMKEVSSNDKGEIYIEMVSGTKIKTTRTMKEIQARLEG